MYIFDGEVHPLNDQYFYIIERYRYDDLLFDEEVIKKKFWDKYMYYLLSLNSSISEVEIFVNLHIHHFQFIHKKPHEIGPLSQWGTYCMKFKKEIR